MAQQLKTRALDDGLRMQEKACEHYVCRSCGKTMISANFVTGICIQVFVSHGAACTLFPGNAFARTREVTCASCRYQQDGRCAYEGAQDARIDAVRTQEVDA